MQRRTFLTGAAIVPFASSCKELKGLLPVIAEIIGDIIKAKDAVDKIDRVAQAHFFLFPNGEQQREYQQLKDVVDNTLTGVLKTAQGAEKASNEQVDGAWEDFKEAYKAFVASLASMGFRVQFEGEKTMQAGAKEDMPLLAIPKPSDFGKRGR